VVSSEIGINLLHPDIVLCIRKLAAFGYTHIYFNGRIFGQPEAEIKRVAHLCEQYGIIPYAAHSPHPFLPYEEANLDQMIQRHRDVLDKAAILRCNSVTQHVASVEGVRNEDTAQFIAHVGRAQFDEMNLRMVRELAAYGERLGIKVAIENLPPDIVADYILTMDDVKRIIEEAGHPNVGICVDTGHAHIAGLSAAEMIREAGELLIETHFHDNFGWHCPVNTINDLHRPPGIGTVDWMRVLDALDEIGYDRPIIFELGTKGEDDTLDDLLRLTRDNWRYIVQAWRYVREGLAAL